MDKRMDIEITFRLIFGDKAYHIADYENNPKYRREWLNKSIRKFMQDINCLDTI
jgi:hypothetical protein